MLSDADYESTWRATFRSVVVKAVAKPARSVRLGMHKATTHITLSELILRSRLVEAVVEGEVEVLVQLLDVEALLWLSKVALGTVT